MAHDSAIRQKCEQLYAEELLDPQEVCRQTGVGLASFYRWRDEGRWKEQRENSMGLRDKLGRLLFKLIENQLKKQGQVDAQELYGLIKIIEKYQKTGSIQEKIIYAGDAEILMEVLKSMDIFKPLLEDPKILGELAERLKAKMR